MAGANRTAYILDETPAGRRNGNSSSGRRLLLVDAFLKTLPRGRAPTGAGRGYAVNYHHLIHSLATQADGVDEPGIP